MAQPSAIDSITASVVQGALENIAVEMGYKLANSRSRRSRRDRSC